jgi:large subunit ribosomal protein L10e
MAKLRKGAAYRALERPYTRVSKYRNKAFVRARPHIKIVRYHMGALSKTFPVTMELLSKSDIQMRHNCLESARLSCNKVLEEALGKTGYKLVLRLYPHHILRENPLASGAGADRMSTGMAAAFGKPVGAAAQVKRGQIVFELGVDQQNIPTGRKALQRALHKLPCSCAIRIIENKPITT